MTKQIGGQEMRDLADKIRKEIPGLGFALLVFQFHEPGMSNYISNGQRKDMIKAMKETIDRLEKQQDYPTPERN
ncbi:hypothetical protein [Chryseobacterium sp. R2A-55]|uniref:hypothetical protein n=1 Tax=Chryseobacterium sp. R2A-55 TaxID=2744445 RepID=UPI001F45664D|nr:hypothetical protein [Chryseobacterium sp. R2A-55]